LVDEYTVHTIMMILAVLSNNNPMQRCIDTKRYSKEKIIQNKPTESYRKTQSLNKDHP